MIHLQIEYKCIAGTPVLLISIALLTDNEFKIMGLDRISHVVVSHLLLSHIVILCNPLHRLAKHHLKTRQHFAPRIPAGKPLQNFIPPAVINSAISRLNIVRDSPEAFAQWPMLSSSLNNSSPFLGDKLERKGVTEGGHVPMQPPKLQGDVWSIKVQGRGLSWHKEMSPAARAWSCALPRSQWVLVPWHCSL